MTDQEHHPDHHPHDTAVSRLLAERARLDEVLRREHTRIQTVFFCDVCGFTTYTETHGDLAARALVERLNQVAMPALEEFGGRLVKTIGDAIMAAFDEPVAAVRFAVALMQRLAESNRTCQEVERIHLRVGLHQGEVIVDGDDLYGDAVNVAARIEPQALPDGILISERLQQAVAGQDIDCRFAKTATMKGKAEAMALYQVVWDPDRVLDYTAGPEPAGETPDVAAGRGWPLWPAVAVAVLLLAGGLWYWRGQRPSVEVSSLPVARETVSDPYVLGYQALLAGDAEKAAGQFAHLQGDPGRYQEAMAALAVERGDLPAAERLLKTAVAAAGDRPYVQVLAGDLAYTKGRPQEALAAYQRGSSLPGGLGWQRARAYAGMGRVQIDSGATDQALASFDTALRLAPDDVRILAAKAAALEGAGRLDEAVDLLRRSTTLQPKDRFLARRLAILEARQRQEEDQARQQRVAKLVDELVRAYRAGQVQSPVAEAPQRTIVWLVGLAEKGDLALRPGETDVLLSLVAEQLQNEAGVELVERDLLDKVLAELKLGSSELADRRTALQLGKLLAARYLVSGTLYRRDGHALVSLRVIETETSRITGMFSDELRPGEDLFAFAGRLGTRLTQLLGPTHRG